MSCTVLFAIVKAGTSRNPEIEKGMSCRLQRTGHNKGIQVHDTK